MGEPHPRRPRHYGALLEVRPTIRSGHSIPAGYRFCKSKAYLSEPTTSAAPPPSRCIDHAPNFRREGRKTIENQGAELAPPNPLRLPSSPSPGKAIRDGKLASLEGMPARHLFACKKPVIDVTSRALRTVATWLMTCVLRRYSVEERPASVFDELPGTEAKANRCRHRVPCRTMAGSGTQRTRHHD